MLNLASYPGSRWAGKDRAWYPLFAHALNLPEPELDANQLLTLLEQFHLNILGRFRNLYVYICNRAHLGFIDETLNFEL